jgi:transposase
MDEVTRHERFCQFRREIRGSSKHLIVGIDIAKDRHQAFFGTARGKTLRRRLIFDNRIEGYNMLIKQANMLSDQHGLEKIAFALEPTGNYHKPLAHWLIKQGYDTVLVSGKAVSDNRQLLDGRWDKNDTKDSANVADLVGQGKCQFYEQPAAEITAVRTLLSVRKRLKKEEHGLRMQIRNGLLARYFPEMDRLWGNRLEENLAIVRWYLDPRKIAATEFDQFVCDVTRKNTGLSQLRRLKTIHDAAGKSVGLPVDKATTFEARLLVERLQAVRGQITATMKQLEKSCQKIAGYDLLRTIPGFGPFITAMVLSAIGNPQRFTTASQVIRLAGLDLNASRSGKKSASSVPKISKRGDAALRWGLYQAALIASCHNKDFFRLYSRTLEGRQAERGIKTKARIKLAAKMMVIAWTMLKNKEVFDAGRLRSAVEKVVR